MSLGNVGNCAWSKCQQKVNSNHFMTKTTWTVWLSEKIWINEETRHEFSLMKKGNDIIIWSISKCKHKWTLIKSPQYINEVWPVKQQQCIRMFDLTNDRPSPTAHQPESGNTTHMERNEYTDTQISTLTLTITTSTSAPTLTLHYNPSYSS